METELLQSYRAMLLQQFDVVGMYRHAIRNDPDVTLFEQMIVEETLLRDTLDNAVEHFIARRAWPKLRDEEKFYIGQRFFIGMMAIDELLGQPTPPLTNEQESAIQACAHEFGDVPVIVHEPSPHGAPVTFNPPAPSPCDGAAFIRWMLISLWKPLGPLWIKISSDSWQRQHPLTPVRSGQETR
ncbi:MAG: hypothetical protein H0X40_03030 [Chthoniobacterales bacterium]|nr:hypothetical protein [Chthoniobacterales bacterium]